MPSRGSARCSARRMAARAGARAGCPKACATATASPAAERPPARSVTKRRADQLLVDRGLAESRTKAQALILAGLASAGGRRIDKPGPALAEEPPLAVAGRDHPGVSRGGVKLAFALDHFALDPAGAT